MKEIKQIKRKPNGQFAKGQSGNQGNRSPHHKFTKDLLKRVKVKDVEAVYETVLREAIGGSYGFCKLFLEYVVYKPQDFVIEPQDMDRSNPEEIRKLFLETFRKEPKYKS